MVKLAANLTPMTVKKSLPPAPDQAALDRAAVKVLKDRLDDAYGHLWNALNNKASDDFEQLLNLGHEIAKAEEFMSAAMSAWSAVAGSRGASWRQIADSLGLQKQTAYLRYKDVLQSRPLPGTASA